MASGTLGIWCEALRFPRSLRNVLIPYHAARPTDLIFRQTGIFCVFVRGNVGVVSPEQHDLQ